MAWGTKINIVIYIEGQVDSAHIVEIGQSASQRFRDYGYKVNFGGASKGPVNEEPKDSIAS